MTEPYEAPDPNKPGWQPVTTGNLSRLLDNRDGCNRYIARLEFALQFERDKTKRLEKDVEGLMEID